MEVVAKETLNYWICFGVYTNNLSTYMRAHWGFIGVYLGVMESIMRIMRLLREQIKEIACEKYGSSSCET